MTATGGRGSRPSWCAARAPAPSSCGSRRPPTRRARRRHGGMGRHTPRRRVGAPRTRNDYVTAIQPGPPQLDPFADHFHVVELALGRRAAEKLTLALVALHQRQPAWATRSRAAGRGTRRRRPGRRSPPRAKERRVAQAPRVSPTDDLPEPEWLLDGGAGADACELTSEASRSRRCLVAAAGSDQRFVSESMGEVGVDGSTLPTTDVSRFS